MAAKRKSSSGKSKGASSGRPPRAAAPSRGARALPPPDGDAPLHELTRDELSVFLYAALLPEENLRIVRDLGLSVPGFRVEGLSEVERCDLIADEIRAVPEERGRALELLRTGFGKPPLAGVPLDEVAARDLVEVGTTEHGTVLALWRVLADPAASVRALARPLLARMVAEYYGPHEPGAAGEETPSEARSDGPRPDGKVAALEREAARAREEVERTRQRGEERAEKLQGQLKEARANEARACAEAARARDSSEQARRALSRAEEALAAAQATDAAAEAARARAEARDLQGRLGASENRVERAEARVAELQAAVEEARRAAHAAPEPQPLRAPASETDEPEEAPASWLLPIYTREFYDSLERWDRRIQRAAFKQAILLSQDHRHPSLRALPLEGLPGYYRVRVATDVRLIYRRGEDQGAVEVLSLIDREDLDRYVRQAKTRGG